MILPTSNSALVGEDYVGVDGGVTEVRRGKCLGTGPIGSTWLGFVLCSRFTQFSQFDCCMQKREESHLRCFAVSGDAKIGEGSPGQC